MNHPIIKNILSSELRRLKTNGLHQWFVPRSKNCMEAHEELIQLCSAMNHDATELVQATQDVKASVMRLETVTNKTIATLEAKFT